MMKWRHSVAFRLFAITFLVVMTFLGFLLWLLSHAFSPFYEKRQIKDIQSEMKQIRDVYAHSGIPINGEGGPSPILFRFENDYFATISLVTIDGNRFLIQKGPQQRNKEAIPASPEGGPGAVPLFPQIGPDDQDMQFSKALQEWLANRQAFDRVMSRSDTLVYRSRGIEPGGLPGSDQLVAVAPLQSDGKGNGTVVFAVSSLQPIIGAAKVIRDFSWYAFGIAFVFVLILALLYARILTSPLRSLNERAGKLASLDFSARIRWKRKDEIGELSRTFDFLADNLQGALAELHDANDKLREDIEREKALERMRRDFVAGVSHELKTPLSLIGGYAEGLKDNIGSGAKREKYAEVILDETRRMSAIVGDMLDLSHLESGQYRLKREAFDAAELLRESADRAEALGAGGGVRVELSLPGGENGEAGEAGEAGAEGDRFRIGQVLTNLVSNAVRHAPDGGKVTLAAERDGGRWRFSVHNEGEPIPEKELLRIWSQFYRIDKARNRDSGGTGIGLAIVKQILELHGSRYEARNERSGVTFTFTLPAADG